MPSVLVTYASKHGATAEMAQTIARIMKTFDLDVTAKRVEYVDDVEEFDVVVFGTAIYLGEWIETGSDFLRKFKHDLKQKEMWIFASGPTGEGPVDDLLTTPLVPASIRGVVNTIRPRNIKLFKGKIDLRRLPPLERRIIKGAGVARGDYRDWDSISSWAHDVAEALSVRSLTRKATTELMLAQD